MGIFRNLLGMDPVKSENKGDSFFKNSDWGRARIEFEKALSLLDKNDPEYYGSEIRIQNKLQCSRESLALGHKYNGEELAELGQFDEARELFELALELTEDELLISGLEARIRELAEQDENAYDSEIPEYDNKVEPGFDFERDDYFLTLCNTLPDDIRDAYISYGESFKDGYIALNNGDFEHAAGSLLRALEENPGPDTYIALELASAYMNLERYEDAVQLLKPFLRNHPDVLPGYQLLCEIFWETKEFNKAEVILDECPDDLKISSMYYLLYGATRFNAERYSEAESLYDEFLKKYGWNESIARALARTYEKLGKLESAHRIYSQIMDKCSSCNTRIDPMIKRKFADISFDLGQRSTSILEMYLSLAQEDPVNNSFYFQRVSLLYASFGNTHEAGRFKLFAEQAQNGELQEN